MIVNPQSPEGLNGWYVNEPLFTLTNDVQAPITYYRWDASNPISYTGPFGLENIPNQPENSSGILELHYWSEFMCGNETVHDQIFKIDLTSPVIKNLMPANESTVYNNPRPTIQAFLDEVYGSNSGINKNKTFMRLDNALVLSTVLGSGLIDATIRHNPLVDLSEGKHNVSIYVEDNAGRNTTLNYSFFINTSVALFNLTVYSPYNSYFNTNRISFNITTTKLVSNITYINYNEKKPQWRRLCKSCDEVGFSRKKMIRLVEGENNLTIRATNGFGNFKEENISLYIDSKKPLITKLEPRKNEFTNGSEFTIFYTENNLRNITLYYSLEAHNRTKTDCASGSEKCTFRNADVHFFNDQYIDYWFVVRDYVNSVQSKKVRIKIDTLSPNLTVHMPENKIGFESYGKSVPFNITVNEDVIIEYIDTSELNPRWNKLCARCNEYGSTTKKSKLFKAGIHYVLIRAVDKAGNSDTEEIVFEVV